MAWARNLRGAARVMNLQPRFPGGVAICVPTPFGDRPDKIHASCKN
jgi:hypothetical protein